MAAISTFEPVATYVNTTDATQTTAATFATRTNRGYLATAKVVAANTTTFAAVGAYIVAGTFKNDGGTLTLVSTVTTVHEKEDIAGWAVTLDASGTSIRVRVTGAAATNVSWAVSLEVQEVAQYVANYGPLESNG